MNLVPWEKLHQATRCLKALAHPTRLAILCALREGPVNVQALESLLQTSQSNVSQHLAILRDKEVLTSYRQANQVFYAVRDPRMFDLLELLQTIYCKVDPLNEGDE